jgi:HEAT repeat protein
MNSKQQEMIEQLNSKRITRQLEAIDALRGVDDGEVLSGFIRVMMSPDELMWVDLEKSPHPKVEAYKAAVEIASSKKLLLSLVDRKSPEVRAGSAYLLGMVANVGEGDEDGVVQSLRNALQDPDPRVPYQAMRSLGHLGALDIQEVLPFFEIESSSVQFYAVQALGSIAGAQSNQVLIYLSGNPSESVATRALAIKVLGERTAVEAASTLMELLRDDEPSIRQHAALALGRMGAFSAVKDLYQSLIDDDEDVRYAVGVALGLLGDVRTIPFLFKARYHADAYTQDLVTSALDRLGSDALAEVISAMRKMPMPYRVDAVKHLEALKDERAMLPLIQYLLDEQVYTDVRKALLALEDKIEAPLIYVLSRDDASVELKEKSIRLLLDRNCKEAAPGLVVLLEDSAASLRELAARSLGKLAAPDAEKALLKVIAKKDRETDDVIAEALFSLGKLGGVSKKATKVLHAHLDHLNSKVRGYSISAIGEIGDTSVVETLIERLMDSSQDNRPLMIQALAKLGDARAIEPLLKIVQEAQRNSTAGLSLKGAYLGSYAVQALATLGEPKVIDLLLTDWEEELEQGIERMGEKAVPYLERALSNHRDARVRAHAAEGLGIVGQVAAMGTLIDALQDEDAVVVQAAAKALQKVHNTSGVSENA